MPLVFFDNYDNAGASPWFFGRLRIVSVRQHPRIEDAGRVEDAFGGVECPAEQLGALSAVPGHVIAADRVMVGDGSQRHSSTLRAGSSRGKALLITE